MRRSSLRFKTWLSRPKNTSKQRKYQMVASRKCGTRLALKASEPALSPIRCRPSNFLSNRWTLRSPAWSTSSGAWACAKDPRKSMWLKRCTCCYSPASSTVSTRYLYGARSVSIKTTAASSSWLFGPLTPSSRKTWWNASIDILILFAIVIY